MVRNLPVFYHRTLLTFKAQISHVPNLIQELTTCEMQRLNQANSTVSY